MELKKGNRVYHKTLKRYGIFLEYDWTGKNECHVQFDMDDGYEEIRHVTTEQLELVDRL